MKTLLLLSTLLLTPALAFANSAQINCRLGNGELFELHITTALEDGSALGYAYRLHAGQKSLVAVMVGGTITGDATKTFLQKDLSSGGLNLTADQQAQVTSFDAFSIYTPMHIPTTQNPDQFYVLRANAGSKVLAAGVVHYNLDSNGHELITSVELCK